jgi:hypothetical protein
MLRRVLVHGVFIFVGIGKEHVLVGYNIVAQVDYRSMEKIGIGLHKYISQ